MQTAHTTLNSQDETLQLGAVAQRMIVAGLVVAVIGAALALAFGRQVENAPGLIEHAYLLSFVFYLMITLGALFFVMLHHLARAGWSVTLRRLAEGLSGNVGLMALLFLPILFSLSDIYPWADNHSGVSRQESEVKAQAVKVQEVKSPEKKANAGSGAASGANDKEAKIEAAGGEVKSGSIGHEVWLTRQRFIGRFVIDFVVWGFLAWYFRGHSVLQDSTGSVKLSRNMERFSAPGMFLFAATLTLAVFDLIMSMNPHWYSTMLGVYFFADAVLSGLVVLSLLALWLQSCGLLRGVITKEHYHDLGKLTFTFVVFWGYIAFSQYMLTWYANIPEETQFFMPRQNGPWVGVSIALIFIHFVFPFLGLMSRHAKRALSMFTFWLIWLLVAHAFDLFWLIMPNIYIRKIPVDATYGESGPLPQAFKTLLESQQSVYQLSTANQQFMAYIKAPLQFGAIATVVGLLVFMGGLYIASTALMLKGAALAPLKDPRLNESLNFHNT